MLLVGVLLLPLAALTQSTDPGLAFPLPLYGFPALLGLQIWAIVFLKAEPALARVALLTFLSCTLSIYMGSYIRLSAHGKYGPEYPGSLIEGPVYGWQPEGLHSDKVWYEWNYKVEAFYLPLFLLDRATWHPTLKNPPSSNSK